MKYSSFFFVENSNESKGIHFSFHCSVTVWNYSKVFTTILTTRVWSMLFLWAYLNNLVMYILYVQYDGWLVVVVQNSIKPSRISFVHSVKCDIAISFDFQHVCCALMCICLSETNGMGGSSWIGWSTTTSMYLLFFLLYSLSTYIHSHQSM